MKVRGRDVSYTMGSDNLRDGMYLMLFHSDDPHEAAIAEVFYSDQNGTMTFSAFEKNLPLDVVEWLIEEAHKRLPLIKPYDE